MKKFVVCVAIFASVVWMAGSLCAAEGRPVIGIKTFENPPNYMNSTVGNGLTDLFTTELMKTGKYKIIERAQVDTMTSEVDFGKSGYVEQKSAVKKGHIMGVQYYFMAKVTNFGVKQQKVDAGGFGGSVFGSLGYKKDEAYVRIDFRIVDSTSAEVVYADYGEANYSKKGVSFGGGSWGQGGGGIDIGSSEFLESMVGRATTLAINNIIDKMDHSFLQAHTSRASELAQEESNAQQEAMEGMKKVPGKILAKLPDGTLIINLGTASGFKQGDQLRVLKLVETKNSKGEIVYSEEKEIGLLEYYDIQSDRGKARLVSGSAGEGDVVKF